MFKWLCRTLATGLAFSLTGCGTVGNVMSTGPGSFQFYGGVHRDVARVHECAAEAENAKTTAIRVCACGGVALASLDVPLSAIGDTLTLPSVLTVRAHEDKLNPPPPESNQKPHADGKP